MTRIAFPERKYDTVKSSRPKEKRKIHASIIFGHPTHLKIYSAMHIVPLPVLHFFNPFRKLLEKKLANVDTIGWFYMLNINWIQLWSMSVNFNKISIIIKPYFLELFGQTTLKTQLTKHVFPMFLLCSVAPGQCVEFVWSANAFPSHK